MISEGVALTLKANIFVRNNSPSIQSSAWARIKDSTVEFNRGCQIRRRKYYSTI